MIKNEKDKLELMDDTYRIYAEEKKKNEVFDYSYYEDISSDEKTEKILGIAYDE